jgi:hypothetical protein
LQVKCINKFHTTINSGNTGKNSILNQILTIIILHATTEIFQRTEFSPIPIIFRKYINLSKGLQQAHYRKTFGQKEHTKWPYLTLFVSLKFYYFAFIFLNLEY